MLSRDLALLIVISLAIRLPWGMLQPTDPKSLQDQLPDQWEYLTLGYNLLHEGRLAFVDPRFNDEVHVFRMPGYPAFVAALGASPRAVRVGQALLDAATGIAVYLLARRLVRRRQGEDQPPPNFPLMAGLLVAVNPWLIYFSGLILSETLFTAFLVWGMALPIVGRGRWWAWGSGIGLLALSVLVRPSVILLVPLMAMGAAWVNSRLGDPYQSHQPRPRRQIAAAALASTAAVVLALLPWAIRNATHPQVDAWIWTTTNAGFTSYDGLHLGATGASDQSFIAQMPQLQAMNEVERSAYLGELARQSALADPGRVARLAAVKAARTWSPIPLSDQFGQLKYILPGLAFTVPFFGLVIVGLAGSRLSRPAKLYLLLPAVYLTLIHAVSVGSARYRIPAEAPMAVIAVAGVWAIVPRRSTPPAA